MTHFYVITTLQTVSRSAIYRYLMLLLLCTLGMVAPAKAESGQKYLVLCYHSVPSVFNGDPDGVSVLNLAQQLAWLRESGYTPIRMQDVIRAKNGIQPLPERAFLLTVDDGFADFYTHVYPLLKFFKVPAVFGVVGRWIEEKGVQQNETDKYFRQQRFVTWEQVKEMSDSGLVEIASHSYDLHHGILANPQGNLKPAAVTLQFNPKTHSYETPEQQRQRVRNDLETNSMLIQKHTGKPPRIMVWPYGAVDNVGVQEAANVGMPINFTLRDGLASTADIESVERSLVGNELTLNSFTYMVKYGIPKQKSDPVHAITVSLDRIYHSDPAVQENNLGRLIEQMVRLEVNAVVINPFTASRDQAYFPNSVLPMRSDLINRVSWQLRSRTGVKVYLQTPQVVAEQVQLLTLYSELSQYATAQGLLSDSEQYLFQQVALQRMRYFKPEFLSLGAAKPQLISIAVQNTGANSIVQAEEKIRFFQRMGVNNFLLDGDDFLDNPKYFEQLRKVLSLKENPYL